MPASEFSYGRAYIWITTCILFICVVAGGACLVAYVMLPEDQVASWLPVAGVILVCLPWAFWLLTFIYRIISRAFGFRVRFGGGGADGGGGGGGRPGSQKNYSGNEDIEGARDQANGKGDVQFGETGPAAAGGKLQRTSSNESETPLAKAMSS